MKAYTPLLTRCDSYLVVVSDARGFPSSVVATGVTLVQLEAIVWIPPHVEDRDAKRTLACEDEVTGTGHTETDTHTTHLQTECTLVSSHTAS